MRFIHTADWHLGKLFGERYMTAEQDHVLRELLALAKEAKAEAIVIAGDIYDRAVPPTEAVDLFDEVLGKLTSMGVKTLAIAGNHDSASRLNFGADILRQSGVYIAGKFKSDIDTVILNDEEGEIYFSLIPYADPPTVKEAFALENNLSFDYGMAFTIKTARLNIPANKRSVAIAHAFIKGGSLSSSERPLSVGTSEEVSYEYFLDFNYTALGHLHAPQRAGREHIRYSGSLLKYSFDEAGHNKGVNIVDIDAKGDVRLEFYPLTPRHEVRIVKGTLEEILSDGFDNLPLDDFIRVDLLDTKPVLFPFEKLREKYPNLFSLTRPNMQNEGRDSLITGEMAFKRERAEKELFADFFQAMTKRELTDEEEREFIAIFAELNQRERDK